MSFFRGNRGVNAGYYPNATVTVDPTGIITNINRNPDPLIGITGTPNQIDVTPGVTPVISIDHALIIPGTISVAAFSTAGVIHNDASGLLSSALIVNADVSATAAIQSTKLANSGATAGTYSYPSSVVVSAQGIVTSIASGSPPTGGTVTSISQAGTNSVICTPNPITGVGTVDTVQDIKTTANPTFNNLLLNGHITTTAASISVDGNPLQWLTSGYVTYNPAFIGTAGIMRYQSDKHHVFMDPTVGEFTINNGSGNILSADSSSGAIHTKNNTLDDGSGGNAAFYANMTISQQLLVNLSGASAAVAFGVLNVGGGAYALSVNATSSAVSTLNGTIDNGSGVMSGYTWNGGTIGIGYGGTGLSATPTDGQILIGKTSTNSYVLSTLTAGSGVSILNAAGAITISATGTGGTVTSLSAGANISLSPSTITTTGSISLATNVVQVGTISIQNTASNAFQVQTTSGASTIFSVDTSTPQINFSANIVPTSSGSLNIGAFSYPINVLWGSTVSGGSSGTLSIDGSAIPGTAGVINLKGNFSTGSGTTNIVGGNNSTSPLLNNVTNVGGGSGNGGTLNLYGGISVTQANNVLVIGGASYLQTATLYGSLTLNAFSTAGVVHNNSSGLLSSSLIVNADITNSTIDLAAKVTGVLPLTNGGTNANLTASNGGIFYSTASAGAILSGTSTAKQVLLSGASAAPSWSTATYPSTTTVNQILWSSSANVIAGLATANSSILVTSAGGIPSLSSTLPAFTAGGSITPGGDGTLVNGTSSFAWGNIYVATLLGQNSSSTLNIAGANGSTGTANIYGNLSLLAGTINIVGGNSSTTPLVNNVVNINAGQSQGGTLSLYGGNNISVTTNNVINLGSSSYNQVVNAYGNFLPGSNNTFNIGSSSNTWIGYFDTIFGNAGNLHLYSSSSSGTSGTITISGNTTTGSGVVNILGAGATGGNAGQVTLYGNNSATGTNSSVTIKGNSSTASGTLVLQGGNTSSSPTANNLATVSGGGSNGGVLNLYGGTSATPANNLMYLGNSSVNGTVLSYNTLTVQLTTNSGTAFNVLQHTGTDCFHVDTSVPRIWSNCDHVCSAGIRPVNDASGTCGANGNRWSAVWAANGTIQTSDENEKKDIKDSTIGLSFINQLKPKSWRWKNTDELHDKEHHGFVFQDVASVIHKDFGGLYEGAPVKTFKEHPKTKEVAEVDEGRIAAHGLNYSAFIAPMVNAINELHQLVKDLKNEIALLKKVA